MVDHDIVAGHAETVFGEAIPVLRLLLSVSGSKAKMLNDDVIPLDHDPPIPNGDPIAWGGLTGDCDVRLLNL